MSAESAKIASCALNASDIHWGEENSVPDSEKLVNDGLRQLWPTRYKMLDGWRAIAALAVVCQHLGPGTQFNIGHIGVMAFFVISGYCIAATSESCLRNGYGFKTYMRRRVRRIYPPYFFAICFFVVTRIMKWRLEGTMQLPSSIATWLQNLTMTQWFSLIGHPVSYPAKNHTLLVAAFWSLNYEEQFYLVIGLLMVLAVHRGWPILWSVLGLMIPAFVWNLWHPSTCNGFFLEYWVQFSLGAIVFYRLCTLTKPLARQIIDSGLLILAMGSGVVWVFERGPGFASQRSVYAEWFITGTFALLLIAVRALDGSVARSPFGAGAIKLGTLTYSLYLVHQFNLRIVEHAAQFSFKVGVPHIFGIPIEICSLVLIALVFWYFCERPFVNKPLSKSRNRAVTVPRMPELVTSPPMQRTNES